jgi:hypothetical protein
MYSIPFQANYAHVFCTEKAQLNQPVKFGAQFTIFARDHVPEHPALALAKWPVLTGLLGLGRLLMECFATLQPADQAGQSKAE